MADLATSADLLNGDLSNIVNLLSAAAALGTAAMGLVDSAKAFWGGPSNFGFGYIARALHPFLIGTPGPPTAFGEPEVLRTLKANWLNGVPAADQKAKAKALIHLGLATGNANALATAAGVDPVKLTSLTRNVETGATPTQDEINVLGQFDAVLSAVLDAAYERADQKYRNACKALGMLVSTILAFFGGLIVYGTGIFDPRHFGLAIAVGLSATPLAPVAKDLATSLQVAVGAVRASRG